MRFLSLLVVGVFGMSAQSGAQTLLRELPDARGKVAPGEAYTKSFHKVPAEAVWNAVQTAFRQSGIKPTSVDAGAYRIAYLAPVAGPKIGNMKIENVFDCGGDKKAPLAKTLELTVSVSTKVEQEGDAAQSVTYVTALAANPTDGSEAPVCRSKGTLERKLEPQIKMLIVVNGRRD